MNGAKVSVIIPVYNVEKYIEECLVSAQNQSLEDMEIICVDDGTPDRSMEIVGKLAESDSRIKILRQPNGGSSSARNAGLEAAKGKYVFFLDSDDYILPETLEELFVQAENHDLDCIYFDAHAFCDTEEVESGCREQLLYYKRNGNYCGVYDGFELFSQMYSNNDFKISACLQLIKRSLLQNNRITFYNGIIHEDELFCFQLMMASHRVMYKNKAYYMRRIRENSIMTTKQEIKSAYGMYICIHEIIKMLDLKTLSKSNIIIIEDLLLSKKTFVMDRLHKRMARQELGHEEIIRTLEGYPARHVMGMMLWVYEAERMRKRETETVVLENSMSYKLGLAITYIPRKAYYLTRHLAKRGRS